MSSETFGVGELGEAFPREDAGILSASGSPVERAFADFERTEKFVGTAFAAASGDLELDVTVLHTYDLRQFEMNAVLRHAFTFTTETRRHGVAKKSLVNFGASIDALFTEENRKTHRGEE